jgi:hypothetical protein
MVFDEIVGVIVKPATVNEVTATGKMLFVLLERPQSFEQVAGFAHVLPSINKESVIVNVTEEEVGVGVPDW